MPNWEDVLKAMGQAFEPSPLDKLRRKYVGALSQLTGRNTIVYYSSFQSKSGPDMHINDRDRDGFMRTLHGLDCNLGLDLLLHTPGGSIFPTIAIVDYILEKFQGDVRVFIPHTAMSAGTIIACSATEIYLARHSCIGPIDPQLESMPVTGLLEEFETAHEEIKKDPTRAFVWVHILSQYRPSLLIECKRALDLASEFTKKKLIEGMFADSDEAEALASVVIEGLTDSDKVKQHGRPIGYSEARGLGLKVKLLEDDPELQDTVLTIHHCYSHTLANGPALKIIENQKGAAFIFSPLILEHKG